MPNLNWDGKTYSKPDNLVELVEEAVKNYPNNLLFGTKNAQGVYDWITYKQFGTLVDNARAGLAAVGIKKDDFVALIAGNRVEWAELAFATYGLNAKWVPMYEAELPSVWKYILADTKAKILFISTKEIYEKLKPMLAEISTLKNIYLLEGTGPNTISDLEKKGAEHPVPSVRPSPYDMAAVIYTSGTTGDPKGVMLSHGNFTSCAQAGYHAFPNLNAKSRSFAHLPWAHVYAQSAELYNFFQFGASIALMDKMETLAADMASVHPTVLMSVPRVFNKIYEKIHSTMRETGGMKLKLFNTAKALAKKKRETGKSGLKLKILDKLVFGKIRHMFGNQLELGLTASAKMNPEIAEFFYDVGIPTYDCYGLTETSPAITMNRPNAHKLRTVGQVLEKITVIIDKSQTGEQSEDGEILIWGPNVMMGYLNKPDKTKEMMTEDGKGIRTGDLGHFDKEGYLYITGRIKEQYKLENGKYCFPNEVEEQIKLLPYISNVMIFGDGKPYNVALAVLNIPTLEKFAADLKFSASAKDYLKNAGVQEILGNEIQNALKGKFGGYEIPRKFVFITEDFTVENGMLTQTMKLKRRNVMKQYGEQLMALYKA